MKVYSDTPCHDWSSHGADAFRIFAVGFEEEINFEQEQEEFDPYSIF